MEFDDVLVRMLDPDGGQVMMYTDLERLRSHLLDIAPSDSALIEDYVRAVRRFSRIDLFSVLSGDRPALIRALPHLPGAVRWMKMSLSDLGRRFSSPVLSRTFPWLQYAIADTPVLIHLAFMAGCHDRTMGRPRGGSLEFSRAIERRYLALGGQVHYHSRVDRIMVQDDQATGVRLADGTERRFDIVVSAADGRSTIFEMLGGKYINERITRYYEGFPESQQMGVHVAFGVDRDFSQEPQFTTMVLKHPVMIAGCPHQALHIELFSGGVVKVMVDGHYGYWEAARTEGRYEEEKRATAETCLQLLEHPFPGVTDQVRMTDVSTPLTIERITGNFRGLQAYWPSGASVMSAARGLARTLPGLRGLYMTGQWAESMVGISTAALAGRKLVRRLCRERKRTFTAR